MSVLRSLGQMSRGDLEAENKRLRQKLDYEQRLSMMRFYALFWNVVALAIFVVVSIALPTVVESTFIMRMLLFASFSLLILSAQLHHLLVKK